MTGEYSVEVYTQAGVKTARVEYFDDFEKTLSHVKLFDRMTIGSGDKLHIRVPARTTDAERVKLMAYGKVLT